MKKVVVLSTLIAICISVVPVHASGQGRADGCRTFNIWAHEPATDETDYLSCGYAELEHGRKVKHTDTEPVIVATESPVAPPVVVFTPIPPIECENEDDDDDNDGDECEGDATDDDDTHEP